MKRGKRDRRRKAVSGAGAQQHERGVEREDRKPVVVAQIVQMARSPAGQQVFRGDDNALRMAVGADHDTFGGCRVYGVAGGGLVEMQFHAAMLAK